MWGLRSLITVTTIELSLNLPPSPYAVPGIREANIKTVKENYGKGTANKKKKLIGRTVGREFGHNQILQTCATLSQIKTN